MDDETAGKNVVWDRAIEDLRLTDLAAASAMGVIDIEKSDDGEFIALSCFGFPLRISLQDHRMEAAAPVDNFTFKILALRYISKADGFPITGEWVAYRDLPGGRFYAATINPTIEEPLARTFGSERWTLSDTAPALNGRELEYGDESFVFHAYPRVPLLVVLHWGDEEFPPSARFLFDRCVSHYLNTDDCKVLAAQTAAVLIKQSGREYDLSDQAMWMVD